jgi:hypothetical protein
MVFRKFGRYVFDLYDRRPYLMNSIVGGTVYIGGEVFVEQQNDLKISPSLMPELWDEMKKFNWSLIGQVGMLGAAENGVVMLTW